ncbi:MAG: DHH family phosphoesterase [bacterium]
MINLVGLTGTQQHKQLKKTENQTQSYAMHKLLTSNVSDTVKLNKINNNILEFRQNGKNMSLISFSGLKNPYDGQKPALQMRVTGVLKHQKSTEPNAQPLDMNINKLANSNWKDGQEVNFDLAEDFKGNKIINLEDPKFGDIGRVPDEIAKIIYPSIERNPENFKFELSNIIAGTTKGAETIGLRVNLHYTGDNEVQESKVKECFNEVLNSKDCSEKVLLYQPKTSPKEILKMILDYETKVNGAESAKEMDKIINNIVGEIENPKNKKILLVSHCKPDGDTIGCGLGLKNAIGLMDETRKVDCTTDDKVPGLFRSKIPGIDGEMKRPFNPEYLKTLNEQIKTLEKKPSNAIVKDQIKALNSEIELMKDPTKLLDPNEKYDLVIMLDIPTPTRFSDKFKNYLEDANKVIYIDHHPHRLNEWDKAASNIGFDMSLIHQNKLAWIAETVPAATQLVSVIADKILPGLSSIGDKTAKASEIFTKPEQMKKLNAMVASLVVGMSTDTGAYTRTANLLPEHMKVPVQERPNFMPEGLSKWLMDLTDGGIDKKWMREEISYDITDKKSTNLDASARDKMLKFAIDGKTVNPDLSLGTISVSYDQMYDVWQAAREVEPETTMLDVQNAFKYSEALGVLRSDPAKNPANNKKPKGNDSRKQQVTDLNQLAKENYKGKFDDDRIAVLVIQDKKAGDLDEKMQIAPENGLRISIRSAEGSTHAEMLCSLFDGGGHGGAAGGRVDLPGVTVDTKLGVEIDGKIERDNEVILEALNNNYEIMHDKKSDNGDSIVKKIKVVEDENGKNCAGLIEDLTVAIRANQEQEKPQESNFKAFNKPRKNNGYREQNHKFEKPILKKNKHISFAGIVSNFFSKKAV